MNGPSRRELLSLMLGVPAAAAACRTRPPPPMEGDLVGGDASLGHRLRDPAALLSAPLAAAPSRHAVVIVGAGPSGLSAAWRLARAGLTDVVVLDLEDAAGGTSRSGRNAAGAFPWGAHYLPTPRSDNRALVTLLTEMGALDGVDADGEPRGAEEQLVREPDERVFYQGAWRDGLYLRHGASAEDLRQLRAFQADVDRWVAFRDAQGRRAFTLPVARCSDDAEATALDRLTMADWLRAHRYTSPRLRWLVDYACRDDYGLRAEEASAWAGLFYFAARMRRPGAPAQELLAWPEGNGRLVSHLLASARDRVRTEHLVFDVDERPHGGDGARVRALRVGDDRPVAFDADQVIVAVPRFVAARVVARYRAARPWFAGAFTYAPWVVANVTVRARPRAVGLPMAWDNVLYDSPSLGYVCAGHQALRDHGPTVLTYYLPMTGRDPDAERRRALALGHREWTDVALSDLGRAHPDLRHLAARVDVYRWGHGMVRPVPGLVWGPARAAAAEPLGRAVHFAHCDLSGVALFEEAFDRGVAAAEAVLAARGITAPSLR